MRRLLIPIIVLSVLTACALMTRSLSLVVTVFAQALPATKTLAWDPNAAGDGVINYVITLDGAVIGSPTGTTQAVTFSSAGPHTLSVAAVNIWGQGPAAPLAVTVVVPSAPAHARIL